MVTNYKTFWLVKSASGDGDTMTAYDTDSENEDWTLKKGIYVIEKRAADELAEALEFYSKAYKKLSKQIAGSKKMKQLLFLISLTILGSSCADQNTGQETVFCDNVTHRGTVYFNNNLGCWGKYIEWASGKRGFICNEEFID